MIKSALNLIKALGGNGATGMCKCPAHDDKRPSLHVTERSGRTLFKCHAGCSQEAVIVALKALGLWTSLTEGVAPPSSRTDEHSEQYERFRKAFMILRRAADRKAGNGSSYFQRRGIKAPPPCAMILPAQDSDHFTGKRFPALVLPIINDGKLQGAHLTWLNKSATAKLEVRDDKPRRIFGIEKSGFIPLAAPDPSRSLIIGEGVETTLAAMQLAGLPGIAAISATNMPTIQPPRCRDIVIAADHDEAGLKAAAQLRERLVFEGHRARIAVPVHKNDDWNDVLQRGEQEAREEWRSSLAASEDARESRCALEEGDFLALTFPKRRQLLEPWLPRAGLAMVHAERGGGKTWFALGVAKAVSSGDEFLGWSCPEPSRVLYVDGELPGGLLQDRLRKFRPSPSGRFHVVCRDAYLLRREAMPNLGDAEGRHELDRVIAAIEPDLVVIDSISTLVRSGIENDAESWAPIQDWLMAHRWAGRSILLVHHEGRSGRPRGTSKREDIMDTMLGLRRNVEAGSDDGTMFDLNFTKTRDFYGEAAAPMRLHLSIIDGQVVWRHDRARNAREDQIREMLKAGVKQRDIAKHLGISPGRLSQIIAGMKASTGNVKKDEATEDKTDNVVPFPGGKV